MSFSRRLVKQTKMHLQGKVFCSVDVKMNEIDVCMLTWKGVHCVWISCRIECGV